MKKRIGQKHVLPGRRNCRSLSSIHTWKLQMELFTHLFQLAVSCPI
jgi:hypothetical protein